MYLILFAVNTEVVHISACTDADTSPLTYTLDSASRGPFELVPTDTERIQSTAVIDYDTLRTDSYVVQVQVSDGTQSVTVTVYVTVSWKPNKIELVITKSGI